MKNRWALASPFVVGLMGIAASQASACSGTLADGTTDAGSSADAGPSSSSDGGLPPIPTSDASVTSCYVGKSEDYIDFCLQKQILVAEHEVFDPKAGIASAWDAKTGVPVTDGAAIVHDVRDDVAYAASLSSYAINAAVYGDTEIDQTVVTPDLIALAPLVEAELATLPASYDGELYMRLRRFANGMRLLADVGNGARLDALADAYGMAIYTTYFHPLTSTVVANGDAGPASDAGSTSDASDASDASDDGGSGASDDGGDSMSDAAPPPPLVGDGILGVPVTAPVAGILYDVDQAASGALALVDLASRNPPIDGGAQPPPWARAAASVLNHLYARARHPSGLYYADLVASGGESDVLASVVTPNDALLSDTQASVAASLLRMSGIVQKTGLPTLASFPFGTQAVSPLSGLQGVAPPGSGGPGVSLWDSTPTAATAASCGLLEDASACSGSGFFIRYLPSTGLDNSQKTIRANALAFAAIHRSLVTPGSAAGIDVLPLSALFESQAGVNVSFLTVTGALRQASYTAAVSGALSLLPDPASATFTAQADAYAIEALTEQWIGRPDCPADYY
jgi:hypothetical protein